MATFIERLQCFMKSNDINDNKLTVAAGLSVGLIGKAKTGNKGLTSTNIEKILLAYPQLNADWLLTGRGEMMKTKCSVPIKMQSQLEEVVGKDTNKILGGQEKSLLNEPIAATDPALGAPYYDVDFIGGFDEVFNSQVSVPFTNIIIRGFEKAQLWCNVTGHSMEPEINHGDIIGLHECAVSDIQYGEIYAVVLDTLRTIKILRKSSDPHSLRYVPINTADYDEQDFPISRIIKVYEVIGSVKKFF